MNLRQHKRGCMLTAMNVQMSKSIAQNFWLLLVGVNVVELPSTMKLSSPFSPSSSQGRRSISLYIESIFRSNELRQRVWSFRLICHRITNITSFVVSQKACGLYLRNVVSGMDYVLLRLQDDAEGPRRPCSKCCCSGFI